MEVLFVNENPITNVELCSIFNMKCAAFRVNAFEDIMDVIVYCSHSVKTFFCSRSGEFVVIIEV